MDNINFVLYENPLRNPTFEITLMESFDERDLNGERNLIPL